MAELSRLSGGSSRRDRGQLILVTGFVLAFTLVALVLLLNTTIYTENIASRGLDRSPEEAVEFREAAREGVGDLIVEVNDNESLGDPAFLDGLENMSDLLEREFANRGTIAFIENGSGSPTDGVEIWQSNFTTFANATLLETETPGNWTVAEDVDAARAVSLNVSRSSLGGDAVNLTRNFYIQLNTSSGDTWRAFVYEQSNSVKITTRLNGVQQAECSAGGSEVPINISEGTIGGEYCPGLEWARGLDSTYAIEFINPNEVRGTYNMTLQDPDPDIGIEGNFNTSTSVAGPYYRDGLIYSATIHITYQTSTLTYETNVTVAPEAS